jgi:hypothetical protein
LRKQLEREAQAVEVDGSQFAIDRMRAAVLAALVQQNPGCFDAGIRATVAVVQSHPADGIGDAAACTLVGRSLDECSVRAN